MWLQNPAGNCLSAIKGDQIMEATGHIQELGLALKGKSVIHQLSISSEPLSHYIKLWAHPLAGQCSWMEHLCHSSSGITSRLLQQDFQVRQYRSSVRDFSISVFICQVVSEALLLSVINHLLLRKDCPLKVRKKPTGNTVGWERVTT